LKHLDDFHGDRQQARHVVDRQKYQRLKIPNAGSKADNSLNSFSRGKQATGFASSAASARFNHQEF
jgi:hypothetical protein